MLRQVLPCSLLALVAQLCISAPVLGATPARRTAQTSQACDLPTTTVYERARASVVAISATSIDPYSPWDRIVRAAGSGVIIDSAEGLVLTNAHVVLSAQRVSVMLFEGDVFEADVIGVDPIYDLAVLRLMEATAGQLQAASLATERTVEVGQDVIAIGSPMGLRQTLSSGVVSAVDRVLPVAPFALSEPFIQTDAAINPGNSGGPLLDRCGEVIGINTAAITGAQNIGFAVPVTLAARLIPGLVRDGRIIRPWLGFQGQLVDPRLSALLRIPMVEGLLIEVVEPGGPAEFADLRGGAMEVAVNGFGLLVGGDIVTHINGRPITSEEALIASLRPLRVEDSLTLDVFRLGKVLRISYTLPERPFLPSDMPGRMLLPVASPSRTDTIRAAPGRLAP